MRHIRLVQVLSNGGSAHVYTARRHQGRVDLCVAAAAAGFAASGTTRPRDGRHASAGFGAATTGAGAGAGAFAGGAGRFRGAFAS